jgi:hypothetical protein
MIGSSCLSFTVAVGFVGLSIYIMTIYVYILVSHFELIMQSSLLTIINKAYKCGIHVRLR